MTYPTRAAHAALSFVSVLLLLGDVISAAEAAEKPNIVVFLADDHGRADCSVYGSPFVKTPTMQALAEHGMVFDRAFVASPV